MEDACFVDIDESFDVVKGNLTRYKMLLIPREHGEVMVEHSNPLNLRNSADHLLN